MKLSNILILFIALIIYGCDNNIDVNHITESGNIESTNIILSSQVNGRVNHIFFNEGDVIKKGDTLLEIDHDLLNIKLNQAIAGTKAAKAKLDMAINGARNEDIIIAYEKLEQANINLNQAEMNFERMHNLWKEQAITKKQFEDAENKHKLIISQQKIAKANYDKIKTISRPEEIEQIKANYTKSNANVDLIKKQISDCYITSPIDAFIVERFVELGESINYGSSLIKLSNLSVVKLVVYINEQSLGKIKIGQPVEVTTDSFKDKFYKGKVIYISPEAEFTPKNIQTKDERTKLVFAIKIEVPNKEFELKAGMPADAKIRIVE